MAGTNRKKKPRQQAATKPDPKPAAKVAAKTTPEPEVETAPEPTHDPVPEVVETTPEPEVTEAPRTTIPPEDAALLGLATKLDPEPTIGSGVEPKEDDPEVTVAEEPAAAEQQDFVASHEHTEYLHYISKQPDGVSVRELRDHFKLGPEASQFLKAAAEAGVLVRRFRGSRGKYYVQD